MSTYILLVILAAGIQGVAYWWGCILKGWWGKPLDFIVMALGAFQIPPLILAVNPGPVALWSIGWVGAYFIGNLEGKKRKLVLVAWMILTSALMVWFGPENK